MLSACLLVSWWIGAYVNGIMQAVDQCAIPMQRNRRAANKSSTKPAQKSWPGITFKTSCVSNSVLTWTHCDSCSCRKAHQLTELHRILPLPDKRF
jgi:hypothetical protein